MGTGYSNPMNFFIFHPPKSNRTRKYKKIDSCGEKISILEIKQSRSPKVVIYSHGNATDIEKLHSFLNDTSKKIKTDLVAYSYSGYLDSDSYSTVDKCVQNLQDVYRYVKRNYSKKEIVLIGRSLGTYVVVKFASETRSFKGKIVLETPMSDLCDIGEDTMWLPRQLTFFMNSLNTYSCIDKVNSQVMVLGAENDNLTPYEQSKKIFKKLKTLSKEKDNKKNRLVKVRNAGHNDFIDVMGFDNYCKKIFCFIYN